MTEDLNGLLPLLRCPLTHKSLSYLTTARAAEMGINVAIGSTGPVTGYLISRETMVAYPVRERIVDLRPESAISTGRPALHHEEPTQYSEARANVQQWYDSFGWQHNQAGVLNDSAYYSEAGLTPYALYERLSHLEQSARFGQGEFLLDAASGAIAHPEYLSFSFLHKHRVCVDFSEAALEEASTKLGAHGLFVLADVCKLPFRDNAFNGVISGYTVQHIHRDLQRGAIEELFRVLKPGFHLCILASQETGIAHKLLVRFSSTVSRLIRHASFNSKPRAPIRDGNSVTPPFQLYGHCWSFKWWNDCAKSLSGRSRVECLRLFGKPEFYRVISSRSAVKKLRGIEMLFPRALARASSLIVVDIEKCLSDEKPVREEP